MFSGSLIQWLTHAASGGVGWWIFSSLVQTMPKPQPMERWYTWLYNFLQVVGANHGLIGQKQQ